MKTKRLTWLGGAVALAAASVAMAAPASAQTVHVSGVQTPVSDSHYTMSGGLIGDWTGDSFTIRDVQPAKGTLTATGEEHFVGCVDANRSGACDRRDPAGTLYFTYTFFATFDPATGVQLSGRCIHPIVGGTDGFRHASGILYFEDDLTTGLSTYVGRVKYRRSDVRQDDKTEMARTRVANEVSSVRGCAG